MSLQKEVGRVNHKLRESARHCPQCFGCGLPNPNGDLLCLAHSNRQEDGKGRGLKARDDKGAILCQACHDYVDGRVGFASTTRELAQACHQRAHQKTRAWWIKEGFLI